MRLWVVICMCYMHTILWRRAKGFPWTERVENSLGLVAISEEIDSSQLDAERRGRKSEIGSTNTDEVTMPITEMMPSIGESEVIVAKLEDHDIDEETIAVLYPDWVRQTRGFDPNTGKTTITIVNRDESEIVRSVRQDYESDWTVKTRSVDLENNRVTLTIFVDDQSSLILELDRRTETVRETQRESAGVTTIHEVDPVNRVETVTRLNPDGSKITEEIAKLFGSKRINYTRPDGYGESCETDLTTGDSNVTTLLPNGTRRIVTTYLKFNIKNSTLIFPDGRQEIRGFNPTNRAEILEHLFSNGTSTSEVLDDRIDEDSVDFLYPLWTRKVKEVDPETGAITMTIYSSDGTRTRRRVKEPCEFHLYGDCAWVETIREIDSTTGILTITQVASDGSKKVSTLESSSLMIFYYDKAGVRHLHGMAHSFPTQMVKCLPGYAAARDTCRKNVDLFGSDAAENMMPTMAMTPNISETRVTVAEFEENEIDEETIAVLYPDWVRQTRSFEPCRIKTKIMVVNRDESEIIRNVRRNFDNHWTVKTRSVDLENYRVTLTYFFHDGSSLILELGKGTETVKETRRASDGTTTIRQMDPVSVVGTVNNCEANRNANEETEGTLGRCGFEHKNVTRPDGSQVFRRTDLATGYSNVTKLFPNGTRKIVTTHPKFGNKNVTLILPDGRQEIRGFNPTNGAEIFVLLFPNCTSTSEMIDDRIDENFIDFLDPLWIRKVKEVDPETGAITITIYSTDGTRTRHRVKEPCEKCWRDYYKWVETIKEINSTTGIETIIKVASDGSKKVSTNFDDFIKVPRYDNNGWEISGFKSYSIFVKEPKCKPGFRIYRQKCKKVTDLYVFS